MKTEHIVQGHWRRQHYGPGGVQTKLIWIPRKRRNEPDPPQQDEVKQ